MPAAHDGYDPSWVKQQAARLTGNIQQVVHGNPEVVRNAVVCLLAEGHLLIQGVPGVAKTTLAKAIAQSIDGKMRRIQFTPDLLPSDVVGVNVFDNAEQAFKFHPGPVFANVVLGDEINRASPKTQSALLEAMAERQVTVDGTTYWVGAEGEESGPEAPHFVIATQNPQDHQGTYSLPEAQLDRFMMQLTLGYPPPQYEAQVITDAINRLRPESLTKVIGIPDLVRMTEIARRIQLTDEVRAYIVTVVGATRHVPTVRLGASPRASNALARACQANAALDGRTYVSADDVKAMAPAVLCHRLILTPEAMTKKEATAESVVGRILAEAPVPQGSARW
nr:MoxR family ATPase [Streptomyces sp. TLI_235]